MSDSRWRLERRGRRDSIGAGRTVVRSYQTKAFSCARDFLSRPLTHIQTFLRLLREAGMLPRSARIKWSSRAGTPDGCATPGAFRHRKHAHERRARARLCQLIRRLASPPCMKRSGAELPLCTWSGCGGRLNGLIVTTFCEAPWRWRRDAPHCAVSRCASINGKACWLQHMLSRPLGAAQSARLRGASLWAAGCGTHVNWPCGGVRPREMRVECRRRPWKPNVINIKCVLLLCRFRSCDSSAAIPERSPTPLHYPLTLLYFRLSSRSRVSS